jgi:hypothetical protein
MSIPAHEAIAEMQEALAKVPRKSFLSTRDIANLNHACVPIADALGDVAYGPYLVGSSTESSDYRDVDVRLIMKDEHFDAIFGDRTRFWSLFCWSISEWLTKATDLPIDFQVQRMTEANEKFPGTRNPMGVPRHFAGGGDFR